MILLEKAAFLRKNDYLSKWNFFKESQITNIIDTQNSSLKRHLQVPELAVNSFPNPQKLFRNPPVRLVTNINMILYLPIKLGKIAKAHSKPPMMIHIS